MNIRLIFLIGIICGCGHTKSLQVQDNVEQVIEEKAEWDNEAIARYEMQYASMENAPKDYVIVFRKYKKLDELMATLKYFVYNKDTQTVMFEDALVAGSVRWHSDYEIIATTRNNNPEGIAGVPSTIRYVLDVKTLDKVILDSQ